MPIQAGRDGPDPGIASVRAQGLPLSRAAAFIFLDTEVAAGGGGA
jgi:hypothetical protein